LTLRVDVVIEAPGVLAPVVATTLGAGGLFVPTYAPLPPRTPVSVRFRLPGDEAELRFQAHVAWSKAAGGAGGTPGMGLEFDDADARAELAALLERWAERREPSSGSGQSSGSGASRS
jgi:uncharacterized protein (TIGR02266 family)